MKGVELSCFFACRERGTQMVVFVCHGWGSDLHTNMYPVYKHSNVFHAWSSIIPCGQHTDWFFTSLRNLDSRSHVYDMIIWQCFQEVRLYDIYPSLTDIYIYNISLYNIFYKYIIKHLDNQSNTNGEKKKTNSIVIAYLLIIQVASYNHHGKHLI